MIAMSTKRLFSPGKFVASIAIFTALLCYGSVVSGQDQHVITGKVVDSMGIPLEAASIIIKETQYGTVSDKDGNYRITAQNGNTIVFRAIGFLETEVRFAGQKTINITLESSSTGLDEVVVVGFGTQKKETVTGAIASIQTKEIKQSPAANLAVTLAGRLPGLTSLQRSGEPGRDATALFIRGLGTTNAQAPIVLVDGVERDLTYIDPNEVESVTILKDASSTAIFGVRGANGVILVTTKRGTSEVPVINLSAEVGVQDFPRLIEPVSSYEFATLRNLAQKNDGQLESYSQQAIDLYLSGEDPLRYPNTNWNDELFHKYSVTNRYNLNISGVSKFVKYFVNAGYLRQGGQFKIEPGLKYDPASKLDRYNFRSNIDIQLNKTLKAILNVAGYFEKQNMPAGIFNPQIVANMSTLLNSQSPVLEILRYMNALPATVPGPTAPEGSVLTAGDVLHPAYGQINRAGYIQQNRSNITATYGMEQDLKSITKGLSVKALMSFDSKLTNNLFATKDYEKSIQVIDRNQVGQDGLDSVRYVPFNADRNTPLTIGGGRFFTTLANFQGYVNYNRSFNDHAVTGLLLYQQQKIIIDEQLPYNLIGWASRLTYGYQNKYFLEFNAGYNGSEQFAKGNRFGFFPAVSAAWNVSSENFMSNSSFLHQLRLRGSYGHVGNDRMGGRRFLYLDDIQIVDGGYSSSLGNTDFVRISMLRNQALRWELAKKLNIGIEIGILNDLNIIVDVFREKRDNILTSRGTIPILNGLPSSATPPANIGIIENKGYEIELNYKKAIGKDLTILSRLNVGYAKNKQIYADEIERPEDFAYRYRATGYRIGQFFGYEVERYFTDINDVIASPVQNVGGRATKPGDFKYRDLNKDNIINEKDMAPVGYSSIPEYTFGGALNVNYKNFDISVLFQGIANVSQLYSGLGVFATNGTANYVKRHLESWTQERADNGDPINYPRLSVQQSPNEISNDFFIVNGSFIRLKNAEIGYTLPGRISRKIGSNQIRIYANGLNLFTWDKLPSKDIDPEMTNGVTYPLIRVINFGINLAF